jgi:hypothetical protein
MSKKHEPTDELRRVVMVAAAIGVQQDQIARMVGVSEKTLRARYKRELAQGLVEANTRVRRRLYELAVEGAPRIALGACCFWLKTRGGFRETGDGVNVSVSQSQQAATVIRVPG